MNSNFYTAFEEKYRGSRELIKSRLRVYLPFVEPLLNFYSSGEAIDLGCGRGEWLELLKNSGFAPQGVDLDDGMLETCRKAGLNVHTHDAIDFLKTLPDASQLVVSAFHLAEHLSFDALQVLVQESLRALKPGGLLILETPNPENITVGTEKFYLDPTHHRPIPSQFLSFMAEYVGFERVKVLRLQEPSGLASEGSLILLSVLNGVSPDYAVVAQKAGASKIIAATAGAFGIDYGLSLENLANNYDRQIKTQIQLVAAKAQQVESIAQQAEVKAQQAESIAQQAESIAQQAESIAQQAEVKAQQAESIARQAEMETQQAELKAQQAEAELIALYTSSSWRITAPLRMVKKLTMNLLTLPKRSKLFINNKASLFLRHSILYVNRRPKYKPVKLALLALFPNLKIQLQQQATALSLASQAPPADIATITPRACRIYEELKAAITNYDKEKK